MVDHILSFLSHCGILSYQRRQGYVSRFVPDDQLITLQTSEAGLYRYFKDLGEDVRKGELLAQVLDPFDVTIKEQLLSPVDGVVFFRQKSHLINQHAVAFRLIEG